MREREQLGRVNRLVSARRFTRGGLLGALALGLRLATLPLFSGHLLRLFTLDTRMHVRRVRACFTRRYLAHRSPVFALLSVRGYSEYIILKHIRIIYTINRGE